MAKSPATPRRSYRAFFVVLALAVVAFGGVAIYRLVRGIELPEAPLANVPRSSSFVGFVRFGPVVRSETLRMILSRDVIEDRLQRIRDRCHLDPATQVEDVILFAEGQNIEALQNVGVVARGPFDLEKLRTCFRQAFAEDGLGEMRIGEIDGVPAAFPAESDQRAAFLGREAVAIGTEPVVRKVIDVVRDGSPSGASDPVLVRLWERLASGQDIVLIGRMLPELRERLRAVADVPAAARVRPLVDKLDAFGIAADVSQGLDLAVVLSMHDAASASSLAEVVREQIEGLKNDMLVSLTPFGPVVRSIRTDLQGTELLVTVDLPRDRLERLIQFATAWRSNLGGGSVGGVQQQVPAPTITIPPSPAP